MHPPASLPIALGRFPPWHDAIQAGLDARYAPSFVDLRAAQLEDFAAVIPLSVTDYDPLVRRPDLRGRRFFHPTLQTFRRCNDKLSLNRFLIDEGYGDLVPPMRPPGAPYPYVWKRRTGGWGRHCHLIDGPAAERGFDLSDPNWFAQTLVEGEVEYATYVLRAGGQIPYVSTFALEIGGPALILGERHLARSRTLRRGCEHLALFADILERLDYEGTACFDYKVAEGRAHLFEINPRFGASLRFDAGAYVDAYVASLRP